MTGGGKRERWTTRARDQKSLDTVASLKRSAMLRSIMVLVIFDAVYGELLILPGFPLVSRMMKVSALDPWCRPGGTASGLLGGYTVSCTVLFNT